ncbi:MAG: hypothetical protein HY609_04090 [Deltaproteobacteria bacterium]|nr:hypothetical protein [Deltaproteobacteria bacterium]MBI4224089.1 hypothetical protein [Deltaproteobacteria bacterium]
MDTSKGMYDVYHIREWEDEKEGKKSFWTSIGIGFKNRDDSINILLNLLPFDGKIQLRSRNGNNPNNKKQKGEQS